MHEENDKLRENFSAATAALKAAESDLEAAKERLFTLAAPAPTPSLLESEVALRRETATLREALRRAEAERDEARAAGDMALLSNVTPRGRSLADASDVILEELEAELTKVQNAFKHHLMAGHKLTGHLFQVRMLADLAEPKMLQVCTAVPAAPLVASHEGLRSHPY